MGILKWFKNLKKKKKYSDDDYIRSTFIHVDANVNAFILFTFTDSYCKSATEFLSSTFINSIFMASSDDEYTDELDEDGNEIIISTPKNYLLIKVSCKDIFHILSNIDISNPFASELIQVMYDNDIKADYFKDFINDGILNESLYANKNAEPKNLIQYNHLIYSDIPAILKLLPSEFNGYHLLKLFEYFVDGKTYYLQNQVYKNCISLTDDEISHVYNGIMKNPTRDGLQKLIQPLYKIDFEDEEISHGNLSSHDVDEIFKQEYDNFNAIVADNTTYMDIDEALSQDDPEYNNLQSNDIENY